MVDTSKGQYRETAHQLFKFIGVGTIATVIHYGIYLLLLNSFHETVAYSIGYVVSFVCNFILTCMITFKKKATTKRGAGFALAHLVNYCLHVSLLNFFLWIGIPNKFAPIPVYCIAVPVNFLMVRYVFKRD